MAPPTEKSSDDNELRRRAPVAKQVYEKRGWIAVGTARPPWLPDDEPSVVAMILPPTTAPVSSALEASN